MESNEHDQAQGYEKGQHRSMSGDMSLGFERGVERFVLALDVGTTSIRCHCYDRNMLIRGSSSRPIEVLHPKPGWFEIDPEKLWQQASSVIKEAIEVTGITADQVACLGISTQRNTFVTWDRESGDTFHNLISWMDLRSSDISKTWNKSYSLRAMNAGSSFLHFFTRKNRFLAASVLNFSTKQVSMRLLYMLHNDPKMKQRSKENQVCFGCIETFLLWKLTGGKVHATDYSSASSTGIYDPFQVCWSGIVCGLLGIPMSILPEVKDTSGLFGECSLELFGSPIPITALVADQQAAMFAQGCFDRGDVKCTLGTGTFVDINTGHKPHASIAGLYPLIGWKLKGEEIVYIAEGLASDTGASLEWLKALGVYSDVSELKPAAESVPDSGGAYFVPAFMGIQTPINDDKACTTLIGLKPDTTREHIIRAVLESITFRFKLLFETILIETKIPLGNLRTDGGVSNNDFIVQLMSDLINRPIDRPKHTEMTSLGAAFLAGLAVGVWRDKEELKSIRQVDKVFEPNQNGKSYKPILEQWERAVKRSLHWYTEAK